MWVGRGWLALLPVLPGLSLPVLLIQRALAPSKNTALTPTSYFEQANRSLSSQIIWENVSPREWMGMKRLNIDIGEKLGLVPTVPRITPVPCRGSGWNPVAIPVRPQWHASWWCIQKCQEDLVIHVSTLMNTRLPETCTTPFLSLLICETHECCFILFFVVYKAFT